MLKNLLRSQAVAWTVKVVISGKSCKIVASLLQNPNRKGRDCPIAPFPMTLSDLYGSTHLLQASSYSYTAVDKMSTDRASRRPSMIAQPLVQRFC